MQKKDPGQRILQKELAADITRRVHSQADLETAIAASSLLFGKSSKEAIEALPEAEFLSVFEGVPSAEVRKSDLVAGVSIIDFLSDATAFLNSKGEARRALKENSISVNKDKYIKIIIIKIYRGEKHGLEFIQKNIKAS